MDTLITLTIIAAVCVGIALLCMVGALVIEYRRDSIKHWPLQQALFRLAGSSAGICIAAMIYALVVFSVG